MLALGAAVRVLDCEAGHLKWQGGCFGGVTFPPSVLRQVSRSLDGVAGADLDGKEAISWALDLRVCRVRFWFRERSRHHQQKGSHLLIGHVRRVTRTIAVLLSHLPQLGIH